MKTINKKIFKPAVFIKLIKENKRFILFDELNNSISEENNPLIIKFLINNFNTIDKNGTGTSTDRILFITQKILDKDIKNSILVFDVIKKFFKERKNAYKEEETTRDYKYEAELLAGLMFKVFRYFRENNREKEIKEIVKLISNHFDLVSDDTSYDIYTNKEIFGILNEYITIDFEKNFDEVVKMITRQYQENKIYHGKFNGWDWLGGGINQSGDHFYVNDRHFVMRTLTPAINDYYKQSIDKEKAWDKLRDKYLTIKDKDISELKPDFLNRSLMGVVLERSRTDNKKVYKEAFDILKVLLLSRRGIPHKAELIYQDLNSDIYNEELKMNLVRITHKKYKLPVNVFVEMIVGKLLKDGSNKIKKEAKIMMEEWFANPEYYNQFHRGTSMLSTIGALINSENDGDLETGIEMFKKTVFSDYFEKIDSFDASDYARMLNRILNRRLDEGFRIIEEVKSKKELSSNQQTLITWCLFSTEDGKDKAETLDGLYGKYVKPLFEEYGDSSRRLAKFIKKDSPREAFLWFAERISKNNDIKDRISKALYIVSVFINDPNPHKYNSVEKIEEYNPEKNMYEKGEQEVAISTVRGWCAWTLAHCADQGSRMQLDEVIELTDKLLNDDNYYIKHMACHPLAQLARNRLSVMPDSNQEKLFFDLSKSKVTEGVGLKIALERAKRVEKMAFKILEEVADVDSQNVQNAMMMNILRVFNTIRALSKKDIKRFFAAINKFPDKAISEAVPLLLYFAELRLKHYEEKNWKWKYHKLYDDLELSPMDVKEFQYEFIKIVQKGNKEINRNVIVQLNALIKDEISPFSYDELFRIAMRNINVVFEQEYHNGVFEQIYYFIKNNINRNPDECYELYNKCLIRESEVLNDRLDKQIPNSVPAWIFYGHNDILSKTFDIDKEKFTNCLGLLLSYPSGMNLDLYQIIDKIKKIPEGITKKDIYEKLKKRDPERYSDLK